MKKIISAQAHKSIFIAWLICSLAALFYTYEYMLRIEPGIMTGDLQSYFSLTAGGFGLLVSMYYWGYTPLQLIVGVITDYYGARRVLIGAILACVIGVFVFGLTRSFIIASAGRLLIGMGSAFAFVGALKLGADWLPRRHYSFFVGVCVALGMLGAMFGETLMSWIVDHVGWHPVIVDSVWLGIALMAVFLLFVYEKHEVLGHEHHVEKLGFKQLGEKPHRHDLLHFEAPMLYDISKRVRERGYFLYKELKERGIWGLQPGLTKAFKLSTFAADKEQLALVIDSFKAILDKYS